MAKEHRSEDRERIKSISATGPSDETEAEKQGKRRDRAAPQVDGEKVAAAARSWLRAALPKLKSLRATVARTPRVDVIERDQEIVVRAAVPGIAKGGLDLAVVNGTLTIRGTAPGGDEPGQYYCSELAHGGFERKVPLPCEVRADDASASIRDGLLELVLPKAERSRSLQIAIR